jgi:hypothetical protein
MNMASKLMILTYGSLLIGMLMWAARGITMEPFQAFVVKPDPRWGVTFSCTFDDSAVHVYDWAEGRPDGRCHAVPAQTISSRGQVVWYCGDQATTDCGARQGAIRTKIVVTIGANQ